MKTEMANNREKREELGERTSASLFPKAASSNLAGRSVTEETGSECNTGEAKPLAERLSFDEARALTDEIKDATEHLWSRILRAHKGKAWDALGYPSWAEYVRVEFQMSRVRAHQLMNFAEIRGALEPALTTVNINERQARPLTQLDTPDEQREAWNAAVEASNGKPTAKHVEAAVDKVKARRESSPFTESSDAVSASGVVSDLSELRGQRFGCIYADPPWRYGNQSTRAATDNHYDTMTVDEICALPVGEMAADRCHLHLWTTNGFLFECQRIFEAWGFEFKSSFVWVKPQMGIGNYWRNAHEILLLAVRGGLTAQDKGQISWLEHPRGEHSSKPDRIRDSVEKLSPGPYLELFGRGPREGWVVFGNQVMEAML